MEALTHMDLRGEYNWHSPGKNTTQSVFLASLTKANNRFVFIRLWGARAFRDEEKLFILHRGFVSEKKM